MLDMAVARARLLERRHVLLSRYREGVARADEELAEREPEMVERATEQHDAEVLSLLGDAEVEALEEVVAALGRVDAGVYGTCTICEEPIAERRLAALPETSTCVACADLGARRG